MVDAKETLSLSLKLPIKRIHFGIIRKQKRNKFYADPDKIDCLKCVNLISEDNAISYIYLSYAYLFVSLLDVTKCSLYDFVFAHFVVNLKQNKQTLSYFIDTRS